MIKLIIFDLDGVLVSAQEAKNLHYNSLNEALSKIGDEYVIPLEEHLSTFDGLSTKKKLKLLSEKKGLPEKAHSQVWINKQISTWNIIKHNYSPDHRIANILKELSSNYKLCVASNAVRRTVLLMLLKKGFIEYFDFFLSNEDVNNPKPYPEMYWECMKKAKVLPEETLIVEDSHIGRQGATSSGAQILGIKDAVDLSLDVVLGKIREINNNSGNNQHKWQGGNMNVLIPMAGEGKRFAEAGYSFPKPLIDVNGKPMIQVVIENLNIDAKHIYVVRRSHFEKYSLQYVFNLVTPNNEVVFVDDVTDGAACTTLLAEKFIDNDNPLIIANSDQYMEWNSNVFMYSMENSQIDGGILTFHATHPKWSFVKLNDDGFITEVAEKKPISDIATVGVYYWRKGSDYVKYAKQMIEKDIRVNGEFYVAPVFNEAIADGKKIKPYFVDKMWGLGTPEDLERFLKRG